MKRLFLFILFSISLLWTGSNVTAQNTINVIVQDVQVTTGPTALTLNMFFRLQDGNGRSAPQAQIQSARVLLENGASYPADVARSPFYVAMLFDSSGSMKDLLPDMQQAARDIITAAPAETQFAIIQFDEAIVLRQTFTNDSTAAFAAIDQLTTNNKGTCLFDGLYTAVQTVSQIAQDTPRQAIIVFTDGRDERRQGIGDTCSQNTYDQLVAFNSNQPQPVRIYPIGVAPLFGRLNLDVLRGLAETSGGQFQDGTKELSAALFTPILNDLSAQWQATADVYPAQGLQRGALLLTMSDGQTPPLAPVTFTAERSYLTPPATVTAVIRNFMYDTPSNSYFFDVTLTGHTRVAALAAEIIDAENNQQITRLAFPQEVSWETERSVMDARLLQAERTYLLRVQPLDEDGKPILNTSDESADTDLTDVGEEVIAEYPFRHEPPPLPFAMRIDAITIVDDEPQLNLRTWQVEDEPAQLTASLFLENDDLVVGYESYILNSSNQRIIELTPVLLPDNTMQLAFQAETGTYTLVVHAINESGERLDTAEYRFSYTHPASVSVRAWEALRANPILYLLGLLALLLAGLLAWFIGFTNGRINEHNRYRRRVQQAAAPTEIAMPEMHAVRVRILETLDNALAGASERQAAHFPYTIGREGCDLNIPGDQHISRKHAQISWQDGRFYLEDNHSRNGTFVNDNPVQPNAPMHLELDSGDRIRIGKTTILTLATATNGTTPGELTSDGQQEGQ
ncbi:MAG: FHA domain-containing protein [Chloroflexota bacterium]